MPNTTINYILLISFELGSPGVCSLAWQVGRACIEMLPIIAMFWVRDREEGGWGEGVTILHVSAHCPDTALWYIISKYSINYSSKNQSSVGKSP